MVECFTIHVTFCLSTCLSVSAVSDLIGWQPDNGPAVARGQGGYPAVGTAADTAPLPRRAQQAAVSENAARKGTRTRYQGGHLRAGISRIGQVGARADRFRAK